MIIKPSTALRNDYGMISDLAHQEDAPIYITKNGEGDLVGVVTEAGLNWSGGGPEAAGPPGVGGAEPSVRSVRLLH